jgi:hypothetical protein
MKNVLYIMNNSYQRFVRTTVLFLGGFSKMRISPPMANQFVVVRHMAGMAFDTVRNSTPSTHAAFRCKILK